MNLDQIRAADAFSFVQPIAGNKDLAEAFLGLARKLPVMLQTNGLLASWAHLVSKKGAEYGKTAEALLQHLQKVGLAEPQPADPRRVLLEVWTGSALTGDTLRRLTQESIIYAVWLKRAAEALCDRGKPTGGEGDRT